MKRRHSLQLLAGLSLAASLLAPSGASAQAPVKGDGGTVRIMISPAGTMGIPPAVIKKFELDKKYGFNLEVVSYSDAKSATAAIQSKAAEIVVYDWLATARLRAAGIDVIGIAPFLTYVNSVVVPRESKLNTLSDLAGKRVGVSNKTGFDWIIMQAAAKKLNKLDISKDVEVREGAVPLLRGLIEKGDLDATQMWNSLAPDMLASGKFRTMVTIRQLSDQMGLPTVPFLYFGMRADYARERPANARAFAAAYRDAVDVLMKNEEVWTEQGVRMKLTPEATAVFKQQVRRDLLKTFTPEMNKGLEATLAAINEVAPEVVGLKQMPGTLLSLDYQ
jgi:NitT/TauT family transport system substrate-binding protein